MAATLDLIIKAKDEASATLSKVDKSAGGLSSSFSKLGTVAAVGAGAGIVALGGFLATSVKAAMESQAAQAQLAAVLKSTGEAAGLTIDDLNDQAGALQKLTTYSDEAVNGVQSLLLTFTDVKGPIMQEATSTVLDMSTALGQDLKSSSIQLGKALNDPIHGLTALRRVGVTFTTQQQDQIEAMQKSGDIMGAQKVILKELSKEFGGSAEAAGKTFGGSLERLKNQFGEIQETVGRAILPLLSELADVLIDVLPDAIQFVNDTLEDMSRIFEEDIKPPMKDVADFISDELIPPLEDVFGKIDDFVGQKAEIAAGIGAVAVAFAALAIAAGSAAVSIGLALLPVIAITAAAALLVGGLVLLDEKTGLVSDAFDTLSTDAGELWDWLGPKLQDSAAELSRLYNNVLAPAAAGIADWFSNHVAPALEDVWNWMKAHETEIAILAGVILTLAAPWAAVGLAISAALLLISSDLTGVILKVAGGINTISGYINQFVDAYNSIADTEIFGVRLGPHLERQKLIDIDQLRSKLVGGGDITPGYSVHGQSYASGTRYVPYDMIAQIHRGEAIIPASENTGTWGGMTLVYSPTYSNATPAEAERFALWVKQAIRA